MEKLILIKDELFNSNLFLKKVEEAKMSLDFSGFSFDCYEYLSIEIKNKIFNLAQQSHNIISLVSSFTKIQKINDSEIEDSSSIASADVAGIANHLGQGKVSMIHFDAHADTGEDQFGALVGHGTPMRNLIANGHVRGDRFLQLGLRGYWPDDATLNWMRDQGMRSYEMTEIHHRGLTAVLDESFATLIDGCDGVFLSVDIDVVDPGMAPGTGTPEPGGMTSRELLEAVRRICLELPIVGIDVVEVAPPFDTADITAILANRVVLEALSAIAKRRSGGIYSATQNLLDR